MTSDHTAECIKLLGLMGMPVVHAPCEAEAQCAALCKGGKVWAAASEDMDTLCFGTPIFLRHFTDPASRKKPILEFHLDMVLEELDITMDQFRDVWYVSLISHL